LINLKKTIITLFFGLIYLGFSCQSEKSNKDETQNYSTTENRLHIKGQTFNTTGILNNVRIRIVYENGEIDTIMSNSGKYNLYLELNHKILIEFESLDNKHFIKRIAFNTYVPSEIKKIPFFELTMNLIEKDKWNVIEKDEGIFDLPIAYLFYDFEKKLWYDKNNIQSKIINKKIKSYGIY
jgi:hypothetical protein